MVVSTLDQLRSIHLDSLTEIVHRDQRSPDFEILKWDVGPIGHVIMNAGTGGLFRFSGVGRDTQGERGWSVILKALNHPEGIEKGEDQQASNYWRREVLACQSCLQEQLPGPLTAPRCYGVEEKKDQTWIWMEYIDESTPKRWEMEHFTFAAQELGRFNAHLLNTELNLNYSWLSKQFHRQLLVENGFWHSLMNPNSPNNSWESQAVQQHFSQTHRQRILRAWAEKERFLSALDQLPQLICHNDFHRRNLMIRTKADGSNELVAVDWNFSGFGPIGSDLGQLIGMSLLFFEWDPADAENLFNRCFETYQASLVETKWGHIGNLARLGGLISIALWPGFVLPSYAHGYTEVEPFRASATAQFGRSEVGMVVGWAGISEFCMNCADQAGEILAKLDW